MELRKLFTDERAVSPVVGVALLIAIAVILAAVIGAVVLGLGTAGAETPQAQLNADIDASSNQFDLTHNGGDPLNSDEVILVVDGTNYEFTSDLSAGNSLSASDFDDDGTSLSSAGFGSSAEIAVVWQDPESDAETVLETWEAE